MILRFLILRYTSASETISMAKKATRRLFHKSYLQLLIVTCRSQTADRFVSPMELLRENVWVTSCRCPVCFDWWNWWHHPVLQIIWWNMPHSCSKFRALCAIVISINRYMNAEYLQTIMITIKNRILREISVCSAMLLESLYAHRLVHLNQI